MNTAGAKPGIATADDKEVVDFAERVRYVLELKINKLRICYAKVKYSFRVRHVNDQNTSDTFNQAN
jgi:hypothetical protein